MQLFETWTGSDFLAFYAVMLVTCVGLSLWIPVNLRPEGRKASIDDPEELALLSGGAQRHALTVLAGLYVQGALDDAKKGRVAVARTEVETSSAGALVLKKVGDFSLSETMKTLSDQAKAIEAKLVRSGLMMSSSESSRLRFYSTLPFITLLGLGLYRQQAGQALGEPTEFLVGLMLFTAAIAVTRIFTLSALTNSGIDVLKSWRERSSRLQRAPRNDEVSLAVGLFGTGVLVGTPFAHVHAMRHTSSAGDGGSDGDAGCGAGCGGGCGGCGG